MHTTEQRRTEWTRALTEIAARPLACCPDFPERARRWEAWWQADADRPLLVAQFSTNRDIRWDKAFDLLANPDAWLTVRRRQMENTHYVDMAIPNIRVDLGPVAIGAMLGAPLSFSRADNTSWQTPIIDAWTDDAIPALDPQNPWCQVVLRLTERLAADAAGNYLVCLPDLSGAIDTLANLRGTQRMLFDVLECPDVLTRNAARVVDAWDEVFSAIYTAATTAGAGLNSWLMAWSNTPYTVPTCDFNFMLSPSQFQQVCLPSLSEQGRRAGRSLFHLDGPGASIHADALAADPNITAIQYTPGAGTPSALAKTDMLQRIQSAGKPIVICAPSHEVAALVDRLDHRGLVIMTNCCSAGEADELCRMVGA